MTIASKLVSISTACLLLAGAPLARPAYAQSEASAVSALSALPVASVLAGTSAVAGSMLAVPLILSTTGAVLVVKAVEVSARGTVCVLERASDGAQASIDLGARAAGAASLAVGTVVVVSVIGAGVILSVAGEAIALIPNAIGTALLHSERLTN